MSSGGLIFLFRLDEVWLLVKFVINGPPSQISGWELVILNNILINRDDFYIFDWATMLIW